jgi:hypothetical protein
VKEVGWRTPKTATRKAEASDQAGKGGPVDASIGAGGVMLSKKASAASWNVVMPMGSRPTSATGDLLSWCRSKYGQLESSTRPRQPRSARRRRAVVAANRPFAAEDLWGITTVGTTAAAGASRGQPALVRSRIRSIQPLCEMVCASPAVAAKSDVLKITNRVCSAARSHSRENAILCG